jgi:hypothetical protein
MHFLRAMNAPFKTLLVILSFIAFSDVYGQNPLTATSRVQPNLIDNVDRPLRYRPDGQDFVIENGNEFFNRPLYGGNTAFRIDAGDRPEFTLYLPGRGGNLRLGLRTPNGAKWLHNATRIVTRYRPGEMIYEVADSLLGTGKLEVRVLALAETEGLIVRAELLATSNVIELFWAYGGVTGKRGRRDGDIGTERVPISEYFQLQPEFCRGNRFTIDGNHFTVRSTPAILSGAASPGTQFAIVDAPKWADIAALAATTGQPTTLPVLLGQIHLTPEKPTFLAIQCTTRKNVESSELTTYLEVKGEKDASTATAPTATMPALASDDLPRIFAEAEEHFRALRVQVSVETPDRFLNAAVAALNVAADAVWDEPQGVVMHGAIAWRSKLLGWRGPYAMDALGRHDRARRHLTYWAGRQNTSPVPDKLPPPDEKANLARSEAAVHSNGDLSNSHYDMNLVYIDALFRHLLWTGDLDFARQVWPVIERHLAWERRLFRREFITANGDQLPLYEAYAAIWASDDLQYNGGGTAHASAYNYYHNKMAARLAHLLDRDAKPYEHEAYLIARAMRELLWMPDRGMFAEYKDWLGLQRIHPSAALWSFYHTIDSEVTTPEEAWQMTRYVDREIPHLPVRGPNVPVNLHVLSTTNWMPYTWSINNVVMGENIHTALAFWQAGRADEAFRITKSALIASMFMGISPGNVGSLNYLDVYRRESQRDFGDGSGVTSRAVIEGLFGIKPDLLAGELVISPGFPSDWNHAKLHHPDLDFEYKRTGETESFRITSRLPKPVSIRLKSAARGDTAKVTVNGQSAKSRLLDLPVPPIEIFCPPSAVLEIAITWSGSPKLIADKETEPIATHPISGNFINGQTPLPADVQFDPVNLAPFFNDYVTQIFRNEYRSPRSPFASLAIPKQGIGAWAGFVNATAEIDDSGVRALAKANGGRITLPHNLPFATPAEGKNVIFTSQWDNYPHEATIPLIGHARQIFLLMAGSTNWMQSRIDNGEVIVTYTDGTSDRLALENPTTWWPIEQDYFVDDYQFSCPGPFPPRVDLKTGQVRELDSKTFKGKGGTIPGGAATVLDLTLDTKKELRSLTVRTLSNEIIIGLMAATLAR